MQKDLFQPESLTGAASQTSNPETSEDSPSAISLPVSAAGPSLHYSPDGPMSDLFGAGPVPVSLSRSQAKGWVPTMSGICGPTSFASLTPAGPLASWENRLRERLATLGSTESPLIWEVVATPAGRLISRLRPWTPHKSGSGSTGPESDATRWPAPTAEDFARSDETIAKVQAIRLARAGQTTTPLYLGDVMRRVPEEAAAWSTPRASDGEKGGPNQSFGAGGIPLPSQMNKEANAAPWPAVQANSAGNSSRSGDRKDELLSAGNDAGERGRGLLGDGEEQRRGAGLREDGAVGHGVEPADADGPSDARSLRWASTLGRAKRTGLEGHSGDGHGGSGRQAPGRSIAPPNVRNGSWWADHSWIVCHDEKARRIPEPGVPLLVAGVSGGLAVLRSGQVVAPEEVAQAQEVRWVNRVAAWKGFGNAINPVLAAEVLGALLDGED